MNYEALITLLVTMFIASNSKCSEVHCHDVIGLLHSIVRDCPLVKQWNEFTITYSFNWSRWYLRNVNRFHKNKSLQYCEKTSSLDRWLRMFSMFLWYSERMIFSKAYPAVFLVVKQLGRQRRPRVGVANGASVRLRIVLHEIFICFSSWFRYVNDIIFYVFRV